MKSQETEQTESSTEDKMDLAVQSLSPWYAPESHFEELPGILCATDLLAAWQPETVAPSQPSETLWDVYFNAAPSAAAPASFASALGGIANTSPVEKWDANAAAATVDCLFRFIRCLQNADVDQAMLCVAKDFHELDCDMELDRDALRVRLERWVDEWRGPELRISLTEIPEPVFHPAGVLMHITVQVDFRDKFQDRLSTSLLGWVVCFGAEPQQKWSIRSLCRLT